MKSTREVRRKTSILSLVGLTLLVLSTSAMAQVDPNTAFIQVADAIEARLIAFATSANAASIGLQLFGFFVAANLVYIVLKNLTVGSGLNGIISDLVPLGIAGAVVVAFLSYGMSQAIADSMNVLTQAIAGQGNGRLSSLMSNAAGMAGQTIRNLWAIGPTTGTSSPGGFGAISEILLSFPAVFMNLLATIVGVFFVAMTLCIYLAHVVMSQVGVYIALMLAPFFVPFLIFQPASFLFDGWLRFLLTAALLKTVGLVMMQITGVIMQAVLDISNTTNAAGMSGADATVFDITKYSMIILLSGIGALLMASASSISSGLISGNGGGASFSGWAALASRSMATRGILGGMSMSSGKGGPKAGGSGGHMLSGVANAMPNIAKPIVNGVGKVASKVGGSMAARSDMRDANGSFVSNGERSIGRDTSGMSPTAAGAYQRTLNRANARNASKAQSGSFYGPPSPNYTVSKPTSSTTPRSQQTKR